MSFSRLVPRAAHAGHKLVTPQASERRTFSLGVTRPSAHAVTRFRPLWPLIAFKTFLAASFA